MVRDWGKPGSNSGLDAKTYEGETLSATQTPHAWANGSRRCRAPRP